MRLEALKLTRSIRRYVKKLVVTVASKIISNRLTLHIVSTTTFRKLHQCVSFTVILHWSPAK